MVSNLLTYDQKSSEQIRGPYDHPELFKECSQFDPSQQIILNWKIAIFICADLWKIELDQ